MISDRVLAERHTTSKEIQTERLETIESHNKRGRDPQNAQSCFMFSSIRLITSTAPCRALRTSVMLCLTFLKQYAGLHIETCAGSFDVT